MIGARRRWVLPLLALLACASPAAAQSEDPPEDPSIEVERRTEELDAALVTPPKALAAEAAERLGWGDGEVDAREVPLERRRQAASGWLREALAPLATPACEGVLAAFGAAGMPSGATLSDWADAFPADRPLAGAPGARRMLVPERPPALDDASDELLRASGLFPVEVSLAGEAGRIAAAQHAGPPLKPALLRHARAARLEGAARLAGIVVALEGGGVDPADLGAQLLGADRGRVGWPAAALRERVDRPVARALLTGLVEDGLRWAVYHYLRGGERGLLAALERPAVGPESLLRPGRPAVRPEEPWPEGGCRLGPRGAMALVLGQDEVPWLDALVADRFATRADHVEGRLLFDGPRSAAEAAQAIRARGADVTLSGSEVQLRRALGR